MGVNVMTYGKFTEELAKGCSSYELAENITGHIMDMEECYDWNAQIPKEYIEIHLPYLSNYKEKRTISMFDVRKVCISHDWYTAGDVEEYDNILNYVNDIDEATTDELYVIAADIKEHSETEYEIEDIMFVLANECCLTHIEKN